MKAEFIETQNLFGGKCSINRTAIALMEDTVG